MRRQRGSIGRGARRALILGALAYLATVATGIALEGRALAGSLDEMISPLSMPSVNEDPRMTTEIRPFFLYTEISDDFVTQGGSYSVVAVQLRVAITDRIALIATKDGYIFLDPDEAVPEDDGFANLGLGLKGVFYRDEDAAFILSGGVRYEAASGNQGVLQGGGIGVMNPFLSVAKGFGDLHLQGYTGPQLALSSDDSSYYDVALHADYRVADVFYPLVEFNWRHTLTGGERLPIDQEGWDLVNLGSTDAGGESVATLALGFRFRPMEDLDVGLGAEFPVTDRHDILDWRFTMDFIWRPFGWKALL